MHKYLTLVAFGGIFFHLNLRAKVSFRSWSTTGANSVMKPIRIPSKYLLLAQNVMKTACSLCRWFCFSMVEKLAGHLLANQYGWQLQSRNYFRQSFENCANINDNLLSTKVKSCSIVVGIAEKKKQTNKQTNLLTIQQISPY